MQESNRQLLAGYRVPRDGDAGGVASGSAQMLPDHEASAIWPRTCASRSGVAVRFDVLNVLNQPKMGKGEHHIAEFFWHN